MKRYNLLVFLILISLTNFAKTEKEISVLYGKSTGIAKYCTLRGNIPRGITPSYLRENNSFGLRFQTKINESQKLGIEIGIDYLTGKLQDMPSPNSSLINDELPRYNINLISTPIYLNHYIGKYFFFNEGIMLDYQKSETDLYSGFGVGLGFGFGVKFDYNDFNFYINPKYERHLFLSKKYGLIEYGVMLGVGYKF